MIKSAEIADPSSCLNQAAADEPIFVLRANDELAPRMLREWANAYHDQKCREAAAGAMTATQLMKYRGALALADQMERWRIERVSAINARAGQGDPAQSTN